MLLRLLLVKFIINSTHNYAIPNTNPEKLNGKMFGATFKNLTSDEFGSALPISGERKFLEILSFFNFQILQLPTIMYEIRKKN